MVESPEKALLQIEDSILGEGLPAETEWHLAQAAAAYRNGPVAERHLKQAQVLSPHHPAVLIGLYRFYFYKGRQYEALSIARLCLTQAADYLGVPDDWRLVQRQEADFGNYGARLPRFYLFTLKAYAYLQLRLGAIAEGNDAVSKLLELDPTDKVGLRESFKTFFGTRARTTTNEKGHKMNISRDSEVVELNNPPCFNYGAKVRSRRSIRNDGTFPGKEIGDILVKKGDEGYVVSIGTFLQQFYIYGVDFPSHGYRVGMKRKELEAVEKEEAPAKADTQEAPLAAEEK